MSSIFRNFLSGESKSNEKKKQEKVMPTAKKIEIKNTILRQNVDTQLDTTDAFNLNTKTKSCLLTMPEAGQEKNENGEKVLGLIDIANENIIDIWLDKNGNPIVTCCGGAFEGYYVLNDGNCYGPYPENIKNLIPLRRFPFYFNIQNKNSILVKKDGTTEKLGNIEYCCYYDEDKFACLISTEGKGYVYDGNETKGPYMKGVYDFISLKFSKDGKLVYTAKEGDTAYVYYGDEKIGPYDDADSIQFDSKGSLYFRLWKEYYAESDVYCESCVYHDGKELNIYDYIECLYSTEKGGFAYGAQKDDLWYVCYGDEEFGPFDEIRFFHIKGYGAISGFCNDLVEEYAFGFKKDDEWYVYNRHEDIKYGPFEDICDAMVSPDKKVLIHTYGKDIVGRGDSCLYLGQEKIATFEQEVQVCKEWFRKTGKIIYSYKKKHGGYGVFTGKDEVHTCGGFSEIIISNDGTKFAFIVKAKNKGETYVINGNEKIGPFEDLRSVKFSSDDTTLLISAKIGDYFYKYGSDIEFGPFDYNFSDSEFSSDGKVLAFIFKDDKKKKHSQIIIDGEIYPGVIYNGKPLYVKDGEILLRD
ncbi:hypothetical protein E4O00_07925 [Treponema sp. OMZ 788]|uniref:hypothetical protein n=1 Tax=Treponema sp. OMZ 788 TaxID=2563664 RepID=UPI0020A51407|nr:hypothetical protein [Treponema sp. OMZ 788]UTC63844.1 hypothetical protein E4O00_07925 [Treponema sp. OMZ 788]